MYARARALDLNLATVRPACPLQRHTCEKSRHRNPPLPRWKRMGRRLAEWVCLSTQPASSRCGVGVAVRVAMHLCMVVATAGCVCVCVFVCIHAPTRDAGHCKGSCTCPLSHCVPKRARMGFDMHESRHACMHRPRRATTSCWKRKRKETLKTRTCARLSNGSVT